MPRNTGVALLGRMTELERVAALLADKRSVVITGDAGVGKTTLLSRAAHGAGIRSLSGQCFRSLSSTGASPLQQALKRPVPVGDAEWTAQWMLPQLRGKVLIVDDMQWADALTLATLGLLAARTPVALTIRAGEPGSNAALEVLDGIERIDLAPLGTDDAMRLALAVHPQLRPAEAARLADRCGGNPLLIEQLGSDSEPSHSLQRTLVRRLQRMGNQPWTDFGKLALAGEPLPAAWLSTADQLVEAGVAAADAGLLRPRHPLLADAVCQRLAEDPGERQRIALVLAEQARANGWTAVAAHAFGDAAKPSYAVELALAAADITKRPGERAALLHLAARFADGTRQSELAIAAVTELVNVGDHYEATTLMASLTVPPSAEWLMLQGRVHWQAGDDAGALAAYEEASALAQPGTQTDLVLRCEWARALVLAAGDGDAALIMARQALVDAQAAGIEQARALAVLGTVEHFVGIDDSTDHLTQAVALADGIADLTVGFTSANNLVAALESAGESQAAIHHAEAFARRADELKLRGWANQMRAMAMNARMHLGDYEPILATVPELIAGVLDRRTRDQLEITLGLVLVDLGRTESVERRLTAALTVCVDDHLGRGNLEWVASEARLWAGDPTGAMEGALRAIELLPPGLQLFPLVTIAHAELRLGRQVERRDWPIVNLPILAAAPVELAAVHARSRSDPDAHRLFAEAAELWSGLHRRGELRCRWLAADSIADVEVAVAQLSELEVELEALGWAPLLGQVRRSLRSRGVRRGARRGKAGELTLREREVLDLVAEGLSTVEVAARLGLSTATVAAQIASAKTRLGAATRWQAASGR